MSRDILSLNPRSWTDLQLAWLYLSDPRGCRMLVHRVPGSLRYDGYQLQDFLQLKGS